VHLPEVLQHITQEHAALALDWLEFIDATKAIVKLSPDDIREIVYLLQKLSGKTKLGATAILVSGDFAYGMMRMLGILCEQFCHIEPFRSQAKAEAYLAASGK
jgi:hypothetical protein